MSKPREFCMIENPTDPNRKFKAVLVIHGDDYSKLEKERDLYREALEKVATEWYEYNHVFGPVMRVEDVLKQGDKIRGESE